MNKNDIRQLFLDWNSSYDYHTQLPLIKEIGHHTVEILHFGKEFDHEVRVFRCTRTEPHADVRTLYRGSVKERTAGQSWTEHKLIASSYAVASHRSSMHFVNRAIVEPDRILSTISHRYVDNDESGLYHYSEYIIDTEGLEIVQSPITNMDIAAHAKAMMDQGVDPHIIWDQWGTVLEGMARQIAEGK